MIEETRVEDKKKGKTTTNKAKQDKTTTIQLQDKRREGKT
jgi:hypothetical protein